MEKTLKSYNDLFKETDGNTAKFYVLYNTNLTYLLTANEIVTFYQIVHVCNINRNYASLNYLKNLLNMSLNTIKKSIEKLILLKLIERNKNYNSTFFYTLNLESIEYIYNNVNSCHKLEERKAFCKQYIEDCIKESTTVPESAISKNDTTVSKFDTSISKFDRAISKIDTPTISKNDTHISNMFIKKDEFHNKNKFNNENESHNKDVEVGEQANAETLNETANANSSFNNNSNVGKESVSTNDVISEMFPELPIEDRKKQADANNSNRVADAGISSNNDKIEEQANADSNDVNKALVSIENKKTTDCSNEGKSFNREPENDVIVDSNDDDFFDEIFTDATIEEVDSNEYTIKQTVIKKETINEEKALAMEYYSKILNVTSIEELVLFSTEVKQLPIGEKYLNELLQLISSKEENFNEEKRESARTFNLEKTIQNNPMFSDWYYMLKHIIDECDLRALLSYQRALENGIDEFSSKETAALQEVIDEGIFALQMKHCVA